MDGSLLKTRVLIIGGGVTGTGLARDLALRGVQSILLEKRDINAGASGANHGLLHSGGRYVFNNSETAVECRQEGEILKRVAATCIEDTGGLFVAVEGDDEKYIADFAYHCTKSGIPTKEISLAEARDMEPALSDKLIAAYQVEDASVNPFKLSLENGHHATELGSTLLLHSRVVGFKIRNGHIHSAKLIHAKTKKEIWIDAEIVVNAAGAWVGEVAALAGISIPLIYSKGSLVITDRRITRGVINRLRPATDGDILVPGGTVSLLGTTSIRMNSLENIKPTIQEVNAIIDQGAATVPILKEARYIRAYAGVRPLVGSKPEGGDRSASRRFILLDHRRDRLENFITITGGKLTTYRLMAEKTADLICQRLGVSAPCLTQSLPLPISVSGKWTEPGAAPRKWAKQQAFGDIILCECELVPRSAFDQVISSLKKECHDLDLKAVGLRSRVGKGSCQGAFCSVRILAYLYNQELLTSTRGLADLSAFLNARWRGIRPVLWGPSLVQEDLQEALHCGLFNLELGWDGRENE